MKEPVTNMAIPTEISEAIMRGKNIAITAMRSSVID